MNLKPRKILASNQRLKLELWHCGVNPTLRARRALSGQIGRPLTLADYVSTSGIPLKLEGDIWVNAPIHEHNPNFISAHAPFTLDYDLRRGFLVKGQNVEQIVEPSLVPSYYQAKNAQGVPFTSFGLTHTDRVRLNPVRGCALTCAFCDTPYKSNYVLEQLDDLLTAADLALHDPVQPANHILLSGGTPRRQHYEHQNEVYAAFTSRFPGVPIDIMMAPMPGLLQPALLKRIGIDGLFFNIEVWGEEAAKKFMRGKYGIGRDVYLRIIESAVPIFGPGKVRSLIIVGLEPLEDTLLAVAAVARGGADPILSPFRPSPLTPLKDFPVPTPEFLMQTYEAAREITERYGVKLGPRCIPCQHNTLTFPDGSAEYFSHQEVVDVSMRRIQHELQR